MKAKRRSRRLRSPQRLYEWASGFSLGAALTLASLPALGHAPPLAARLLSGSTGDVEVVVTNRGLVFREPRTGAARLLCNEALGINPAELPNVALLADGSILVATSGGLRRSSDQGCSWSEVGALGTTSTPALASDPTQPNRIFVASYGGDGAGIERTRDGGASWELSYATLEGDYVRSILISAADPRRLYATLTHFEASGPPTHFLLRTSDDGATWQRVALALSDTDYLALPLTSDPHDPDTVVLSTVAFSPGLDASRLLVSRDAGDRFDVVFESSEITGAGYGSGGGSLWIASRDGLYRSNDALTEFEQVSAASHLGCAVERGGALMICGHYAGVSSGRPGIGISTDAGNSFSPWLDFSEVEAPVACDIATETRSLCERPWQDWELEMLGGSANPLDPALGSSGASSGAATGSEAGSGEGGAVPSPGGAAPIPAVEAGPLASAGVGAASGEAASACGLAPARGAPLGLATWLSVAIATWAARRRSRAPRSASARRLRQSSVSTTLVMVNAAAPGAVEKMVNPNSAARPGLAPP